MSAMKRVLEWRLQLVREVADPDQPTVGGIEKSGDNENMILSLLEANGLRLNDDGVAVPLDPEEDLVY